MIGLEALLRPEPSRRPPSLRRARVTSMSPLRVVVDGDLIELDVAESAPAGVAVGSLVQVVFVGRKLTIQSLI